MASKPRSDVKESARAVNAFFAEILAAGPPNINNIDVACINVRQWMHFLAHYRLLGTDFTHLQALQLFQKETEELEGLLDEYSFKDALTKVAMELSVNSTMKKRASNASMSSATNDVGDIAAGKKSAERAALEELVSEINSKRDFVIDQACHNLFSPLYEPDVIRAAYSYSGVLHGLYHHYAAVDAQGMHLAGGAANVAGQSSRRQAPPMVSGRSFYRLCCAVRLVPGCIVPGELSDVMAQRYAEGRGRSTSRTAPSVSERQEQTAARHYLEEDRMIDGSDDAGWMVPARGFLHGEPRYTFPELVENLVMVAFTVPPRTFGDDSQVRAQRIQDIFGLALGLPSMALGGSVQEAMELCSVKEFLEGVFVRNGGRIATKGGQVIDLRDIMVRLSEELPQLPQRREPYIPHPPPHKDLAPQPETVEEKLLMPPGFRNDSAREAKGKKKGAKKGKKGKNGPVEMYKVIWYSKREPPSWPEMPRLGSERRTKVLEESHHRLMKKAEQMTAERTGMVANLAEDPAKGAGSKGVPFTERGGLRLALIDEPLRAPRCKTSEEVSTLMETALAARRLRHYEEAVALLIGARSLWAALAAGRPVGPDWGEVQPWIPAPSPWGTGMFSAAKPISLTEGGRSQKGDCNSGCHESMPGPPEKGAGIREGKAVFRRFQTTCAQAHAFSRLRTRTGATAALAAAATSASGAGDGESPGVDMDKTIMPSDLQRERTPVPPQSARGSARPPHRSSSTLGRGGSTTPLEGGSGVPAAAWAGPIAGQADRTSRPASVASGRSSMPGAAEAAGEAFSTAVGRRYSAKEDFKLALGDDNPDLAKLPPEAAIFFLYELASLHSAMREDELAAQLLWRARAPTDRLPASHPDTAVVWCGLGRLAYLGGAFEVAARSMWRGRKIRERTLGGDTVETATSYNNLACCFFALDRPQEALVHLELAEEILRVLAGEDHPRTQTTLRNLEKARAANKSLHAEVPNIFSYFVPETKLRGKGKKKKKGKKGGGSTGGSRASSAGSTATSKSSKTSKK